MIALIETGDHANWRTALPELHDYEIAFGPVLDSFKPDVVHAQDVHFLGVAARAVARARGAGLDTKLIYDAHEYIPGLASPRPAKAWADLESEYIGRADAVITVAPAIAERLEVDHDLSVSPTIVMNIPTVGEKPQRGLRQVVGLSDSDLLLVYSGGLDETRGVHTLVHALGQLPNTHLALVSKASTYYTEALQEIAREGGYLDRLHFAPFVEPQQVVDYLASADVGVHTIVAGPINHELTLPNKVFEYMHARLPIVISSCRAMSELVERLGVGRSFSSEDVPSLVRSLTDVIENHETYKSVYREHPDLLETYSWKSERRKLFDLYALLVGGGVFKGQVDEERLPSLVRTVAT